MKKIFVLLLFFISIVFLCNQVAFAAKKDKCEKPVYYFQDADKNTLFDELDKIMQANKIYPKKFYPELGFMSFDYRVKVKSETVVISLKQQAQDVYMFIDISKNNTKLEKTIYNSLKKHSKTSYLIEDELLCKDYMKDTLSINKNRKPVIKEVVKSDDGVYRIGMNRYIGYDKKTYFKDKLHNLRQKIKGNKSKKKSQKQHAL